MYKNIYSEKNLFFDCPGGGLLPNNYKRQHEQINSEKNYLRLAYQHLCFLWILREPEKLIETSTRH